MDGRSLVEFDYYVPRDRSHYRVFKQKPDGWTPRLDCPGRSIPAELKTCQLITIIEYGSVRLNDSEFLLPTEVATMLIDIYMDGFSPHWRSAPLRRAVNQRRAVRPQCGQKVNELRVYFLETTGWACSSGSPNVILNTIQVALRFDPTPDDGPNRSTDSGWLDGLESEVPTEPPCGGVRIWRVWGIPLHLSVPGPT